MISLGVVFQKNSLLTINEFSKKIELSSITTDTKIMNNDKNKKESIIDELLVSDVVVETAPASVIIPPRVEVYEGMTIEELSDKLNKSLGGILSGHGDVIASHSIELGVDPYVVAAIMMHETGNGTSRIANSCFNFGGQKGSGCGAYKKYDTVDDGLRGIIDNLYKNYYAYGLNTVESIGHKYAESQDWPNKINWYVNKIRSN